MALHVVRLGALPINHGCRGVQRRYCALLINHGFCGVQRRYCAPYQCLCGAPLTVWRGPGVRAPNPDPGFWGSQYLVIYSRCSLHAHPLAGKRTVIYSPNTQNISKIPSFSQVTLRSMVPLEMHMVLVAGKPSSISFAFFFWQLILSLWQDLE